MIYQSMPFFPCYFSAMAYTWLLCNTNDLRFAGRCQAYLINVPSDKNFFGLGNTLASVIFTIRALEGLFDISSQNMTFSIRGRGYGDVIPGLLEPVHSVTCRNQIQIDAIPLFVGCCSSTDAFILPKVQHSFHVAHAVFFEYFRVAKLAEPVIPVGTLGLHYRGTDRIASGMTFGLSPVEFVVLLKDFLSRNSFQALYVASDVQTFVDLISYEFPYHQRVSFDQRRGSSGSITGLHFLRMVNVSKGAMGRAAFIDMLALSKCAAIFRTTSSFSAFAKVLNPSIKLVTITANRVQPFFPEGVPSNDYLGLRASPEAKAILRRTMRRPIYSENRSSRQMLGNVCPNFQPACPE